MQLHYNLVPKITPIEVQNWTQGVQVEFYAITIKPRKAGYQIAK